MANKQILIIEDDSGLRFVLERFLSQFFKVTSKSDGKQALTWMVDNRPDLVITDLDMPVLNGLQVLRNIRSSLRYKDLKIIVISGYDDDEFKKTCQSYDILDYYVKPFNPVELVLKIYDQFNISYMGNKKIEKLMQMI